tara:strand:- start:591 stop:1187 length:597 start_codon:yes stop_codon:yes gene_type:complete
MKKLSIYLFLVLFSFSAPSFADDISDFQIVGMSIGDSLLDYYSEEEINGKKKNFYPQDKNNEVYYIAFNLANNPIYENILFHIKNNDNKYKILAISAAIWFKDNIEDCYQKKDLVVAEISNLFKNTEKEDQGKQLHEGDKTQKSFTTDVFFWFEDDSNILISCYDWSEELTEKNNFWDHLKVSINSRILKDFLNKIYQ